jgi:hypothetical protein
MAKKRFTVEQIIGMLRQAELELAKGRTTRSVNFGFMLAILRPTEQKA